ncbi:MAG: hypothetical protein ACI857_002451 [Arenicella sp.]|jgi:hypothetical protein
MKLSLLCIIGCFLISCSSNEAPTPSEPKDPSIRDTFDLPLDTLAILDMMDIPLSAYHDTILADYELDTFDLIYQMYACDCQRWIEVEEYDKSIDTKNTEYYHLDVSEHGFFIKPAFHDVEIHPDIHYQGNKIRFIGYWEEDPDYYTQSLIPTKKRVLTYFGYEVIKPVRVWGPKYHSGETELPNGTEEMINTSQLTIR